MTTTRRNIARLVVACLLAVAAFAAYHFYLRELMLESGLILGAVRPGKKVYRIVPLYIYWRPRLKTGVLIAAAVLAGFVCWMRRSLVASGTREFTGSSEFPTTASHSRAHVPSVESPAGVRPSLAVPHRGRMRYVVALMVWHIAIAVSVALVDGGPQKLWEPYSVHRRSEYIGAVDKIERPRDFLRDYPSLMRELPLHCRTHPAGAPLVLWVIAQLFGPGAFSASMATILLSSLVAPAVYLLARDVLDEAPARLAGGLFVLAPNVACYSATCMDAVFMVPLVWSFYFLWHGRTGRSVVWGVAGGISTSIAAVLTFSTAFLALWAVVVIGLTILFDRPRVKSTMLTFIAALIAGAILYGLLYAWSGYNPLEVLGQAFIDQDEEMIGRGHSSFRQWFHFTVTNLVAFFFCTGIPMTLFWFRQTVQELWTATATRARWLSLSFALTLLAFDAAPLYTIETERLWIFLVGFLAIGASARVSQVTTSLGSSAFVAVALLLQAGQTLLMEALLDWVW